MNVSIPQRLQIFVDGNVVLSDKDAERLTPYLGGWPTLHKFFVGQPSNEADLKRLVIMELMGDRRETLINRLLARLSAVQQNRWRDSISEAVDLVPAKRRRKKR
jgi:hypothetical protein